MRRASEFRCALRTGRRAARPSIVVHLTRVPRGAVDDLPGGVPGDTPDETADQVGFVVSKAVGNAVVRNRVKRRLRAVVAERLDSSGHLVGEPLDTRSLLVIRALPSAANASFAMLADEVDGALTTVRRRLAERTPAETTRS